MKRGWVNCPIEDLHKTITPPAKIRTTDYQESGEYPIVSQDAKEINGYWDKADDLVHVDNNVVICFGDHTKVVKYVDFDFVQGADGLKILLPNKKMYPRFFYYGLLNTHFRDLGYARHYKLLKKQLMPYPESLPEQRRIVGILDAAFEKIDAVQRNAERNLANAKELFQRVLDEEMTPKEGWSRAKIKDFSEVRIGPFGSLLHKSDYVEDGIPIVNPCHMRNNILDEHISQKITVSKAKELSGYALLENDIVFARRGDIGRCALISSHEVGYLCGTGSLFVRIKNRILPSFLFLLAQNRSFISALAKTSTGTTMSSINVDSIAEMEISFPTIDMQKSILKKLSAIRKSCQEIDLKNVKLKVFFHDLKQQILTKAFNGEL